MDRHSKERQKGALTAVTHAGVVHAFAVEGAELVGVVATRRQVLDVVEELGAAEHHVEVAGVDELRVEGVALYEAITARTGKASTLLFALELKKS